MIRKCLYYSFFILKWNLVLSSIITLFALMLSQSFLVKKISLDHIIYLYTISFLTGGYILGAFFYELSRSREYYFFYNLGISRIRLFMVTYILHIFFILALLIIIHYAKLFGG